MRIFTSEFDLDIPYIKQSHGVKNKTFCLPPEPGFGWLEKPAKNSSDKCVGQKAQAQGGVYVSLMVVEGKRGYRVDYQKKSLRRYPDEV